MEKQNKNNFSRVFFTKKTMSLLGLAALTVGLTIYFRANRFESFVAEQKGNLLSFYTKSLKPLFLGKEVTNEDIFNFAFYRELPLDKENHQYLRLGSDTSSGKQFVEFRDVSAVQKTNNLEAFSKNLDLNARQRRQVDSILNLYGEKIKSQVLVNENNTVAINENLWNLNKALLADLFMFASRANRMKFREMVAPAAEFADNPELPKIVSKVKSADVNRYIFVTSDSVFSHDFNFNMDEYRKEAEQGKLEAEKGKREAEKAGKELKLQLKFEGDYAEKMKNAAKRNKGKDYIISIDPNRLRVQVPKPPDTYGIPDAEEIARQVEAISRQAGSMKFKMKPPVIPRPGYKGVPKPERAGEEEENNSDSSDYFELNIEIPNVDSIIEHSMKNHRVKNYRGNRDSLAYINWGMDSLDRARLKEEMRRAGEELKKLKKISKQKSGK